MRNLTTVERYHAARRDAGHPYIITVVVTCPRAPTPDHNNDLDARLAALQNQHPRLTERVKGGRWVPGAPCVVRREEYSGGGAVMDVDEILKRAGAEGNGDKSAAEKGAQLLSVTLYGGTTLAVSAGHELMDGRGLLRFTHALFGEDVVPPAAREIAELDVTPTWTYWLPRRAYLFAQAWLPQHPVDVRLPGRTVTHSLDAGLTDALKSLSRFHGIPTLTPVLQLAFLVAIANASPRGAGAWSAPLTVVTPLDERSRDPAQAHATFTGQYTTSHLSSVNLSATTPFWVTARAIALQLAHPASRAAARMNVGMLDAAPVETHLARTPPTLSFSNLGKTTLPRGATDLVVAGSPSVGDPPWEVVLCGHERGVRLCTAYRDGQPGGDEVKRVHAGWERILRRLVVDGKEYSVGDLSV